MNHIRMNLWYGCNYNKLIALASWLGLDQIPLPLTDKHPLFSDSFEHKGILHVNEKSYFCKKCKHGKYEFKPIFTTKSISSSIFNQTH